MVTPDGDCKCKNCLPVHSIVERRPGGPYLDEQQAQFEEEMRIARLKGIPITSDTSDEELAKDAGVEDTALFNVQDLLEHEPKHVRLDYPGQEVVVDGESSQ